VLLLRIANCDQFMEICWGRIPSSCNRVVLPQHFSGSWLFYGLEIGIAKIYLFPLLLLLIQNLKTNVLLFLLKGIGCEVKLINRNHWIVRKAFLKEAF